MSDKSDKDDEPWVPPEWPPLPDFLKPLFPDYPPK